MIGNDVIDLQKVSPHSKIDHPRWQTKVLTPSEIEQLPLFPNLRHALWSFWALKESAYKIFFKKTAFKGFIPKKLICTFSSPFQAEVRTPAGLFWGRIHRCSSYLHAVVVEEKLLLPQIQWAVHPLLSTDYPVQSKSVRRHLLQSLSRHCRLPYEELGICKKQHFPRVVFQNKAIAVDVSMSHHYYWGAYAFLQAED